MLVDTYARGETAPVDLAKPSLRALAYVLRRRETWPPGFNWYFSRCQQCALNMTCRLWAKSVLPAEYTVGTVQDMLGIDNDVANYLFGYSVATRRGLQTWQVTPEMVADDIEGYLASRAS